MQRIHMPSVDARYWLAITLASLFGTNMGDLWAHNSGLNKIVGLAPLILLAAIVFLAERRDRTPREVYYWLAIIVIRTGATNIADYCKKILPWPLFAAILAALMIGFAWASVHDEARADPGTSMPATGKSYWAAMLSAGVLGTFYGDVCSKLSSKGIASLGLGLLLLATLALWRGAGARRVALYWLVVAVARSAGTAMGDFLADDPRLDIGLALSTIITGVAFAAVLLLWRGASRPQR